MVEAKVSNGGRVECNEAVNVQTTLWDDLTCDKSNGWQSRLDHQTGETCEEETFRRNKTARNLQQNVKVVVNGEERRERNKLQVASHECKVTVDTTADRWRYRDNSSTRAIMNGQRVLFEWHWSWGGGRSNVISRSVGRAQHRWRWCEEWREQRRDECSDEWSNAASKTRCKVKFEISKKLMCKG